MKITEEFGIAWKELTGKQKAVVIGLALFLGALMISGWIDSFTSWKQIRQYEAEAAQAERDKDAALTVAAAKAAEIKKREEAIAKLETQIDEKQKQLDTAGKDVADALAEYNRARDSNRTDAPSADQLCEYLATLGHPCR